MQEVINRTTSAPLHGTIFVPASRQPYREKKDHTMNHNILCQIGYVFGCIVLSGHVIAQQTYKPWKVSVMASAEIQTSPLSVKLAWNPNSAVNVSQYNIWRKLPSDITWGTVIASLPAAATTWVDTDVQVNKVYEYKIERLSDSYTGYGYLAVSVGARMDWNRGKLLLLVDDAFIGNLDPEISGLIQDLEADGWTVLRNDVSSTATVSSIKSIITTNYNSDPQNTKAVFLLGHIPVPYSGGYSADGHSEHNGAWPADLYYGDVNGVWTDSDVNITNAQDLRNNNVPGDGKFDQSDAPSAIELAVGRVDFHGLPLFSNLTETELMQTYLNKLHTWKMNGISVQNQSIVDDNFQDYLDGFASNGYRGFAPLVGWDQVEQLDYLTTLEASNYLWSYGCGSGSWANAIYGQKADGVVSTLDFASKDIQGVFTILFGSYFGDWDSENNLLRAALGSGNVLTSFWAGWPNWYFQQMGIGEPIGYSARRTQNNANAELPDPLYTPTNHHDGSVHVALMGDPTLRMKMVAPPTNVTATKAGNEVIVTWTASTDATTGYYVFGKHPLTGRWYRLTNSSVQGTTITFTGIYANASKYMVRSEALTTGFSGSYYNLSLGSMSNEVNMQLLPNGTSSFGTKETDGGTEATARSIAVYPNPTTGQVMISGLPSTEGTAIVFSATGSEVLRMALSSTLDLSTLLPGTYFLVAKDRFGNIMLRAPILKQ